MPSRQPASTGPPGVRVVTIAIDDGVTPPRRGRRSWSAPRRPRAKIEQQYEREVCCHRASAVRELIAVWTEATNKVADAMQATLPEAQPASS